MISKSQPNTCDVSGMLFQDGVITFFGEILLEQNRLNVHNVWKTTARVIAILVNIS